MKWEGNVRKMASRVDSKGHVKYFFCGADVLEPMEEWSVNDFVGQRVAIRFVGDIHCVATGKKIKKTYGEGLSYDCLLYTSPSPRDKRQSRMPSSA